MGAAGEHSTAVLVSPPGHDTDEGSGPPDTAGGVWRRWADAAGRIPGPGVIVVGAAAFVAGYWWVAAVEPSGPGRAFGESPEFQVWAVLIGANVAAWPIAIWASYAAWRELAGHFAGRWHATHRLRRRGWIAATLAALGAAFLAVHLLSPSVTGDVAFVEPWRRRTVPVAFLAHAAAVPAAWFIVAVALAAQELAAAGRCPQLGEVQAAARQLARWLAVISGLLALAVLQSAALRDAVAATPGGEGAAPAVLVPLFGAALTVGVAILYVPAHVGLARLGTLLIGHCGAGVEAILAARHVPERFEALVKRREWLESQLDAGSAGQRLRSTLVVLAPVLSGLGSYLIG